MRRRFFRVLGKIEPYATVDVHEDTARIKPELPMWCSASRRPYRPRYPLLGCTTKGELDSPLQ